MSSVGWVKVNTNGGGKGFPRHIRSSATFRCRM